MTRISRSIRYHVPGITTTDNHNRRLRPGQQSFLKLSQTGQLPRHGQIRHHHRKRLFIPLFPFTQSGHSLVITGINSQVIATQPLHCHDQALMQQRNRMQQRSIPLPGALDQLLPPAGGGREGGVPGECQLRTTVTAGDRLGMETPIQRITVLGFTGRAEGKSGHGGQGTVIGDTGYNSPAGTAVGTGDKGMAVAAASRISQLPQAVGTGGTIRGYLCLNPAIAAGKNHKAGLIITGREITGFK